MPVLAFRGSSDVVHWLAIRAVASDATGGWALLWFDVLGCSGGARLLRGMNWSLARLLLATLVHAWLLLVCVCIGFRGNRVAHWWSAIPGMLFWSSALVGQVAQKW